MKKKTKKTAPRPATAARPAKTAKIAGIRVVGYESARSTCRRIVEDLVDLADERQRQRLYLEALDNAIRAASISPEGHDDLNRLRGGVAINLELLERQIRDLLAATLA